MLATLAAGASLWFIALQVFAIGEFCWYCLTTDSAASLLAAITAWSVLRWSRSSATQQFARVSDTRPAANGHTLRQRATRTAGPTTRHPSPGVVRTPARSARRSRTRFVASLAIAYGGAAALLLVLIGGQIVFRAETFEVQQVTLTESIDMSGNGKESVAAASESDEASTRVAMRIPAEEGDPIEQPTDVATAAEGNDNETSDADRSPGSSATTTTLHQNPRVRPQQRTAPPTLSPRRPQAQRLPASESQVARRQTHARRLQAAVIGNPEAPHVVAEIISYDCPHCRKTHRLMKQAMVALRRPGGAHRARRAAGKELQQVVHQPGRLARRRLHDRADGAGNRQAQAGFVRPLPRLS